MEKTSERQRIFFESNFSFDNINVTFYFGTRFWREIPEKYRNNDRHDHAWYEFHFVIDGAMNIKTDSTKYLLQSGDALLIPPKLFHASDTIIDYTNFVSFGFEIKNNKKRSSEDLFTQFYNALSITDCRLIPHSPTLLSHINKLCGYTRAGLDLNCCRVNTFLTTFLFSLYDRLVGEGTHKRSENCPRENSSFFRLDFMSLDDAINSTLDDISQRTFMSKKQINRLCKERYDMTYKQRQIRVRIENAKKLLTETELTVDEIATMVGYTNLTSFYKTFRTLVGVSPSQYRKGTFSVHLSSISDK